ncbi:MAG: signal peptidase II [Deltaproteobacteria bacterium]|nr:signal peptidase II [Deltaproteobacteria bacterium]
MRIQYLILLTLSGFVVALDQVTKLYVSSHYLLGQTLVILENVLHVTYSKNVAGMFDMFQSVSEGIRLFFFLLIPAIAIVFILGVVIKYKNLALGSTIGFSLIVGGALGNMLDRIRFQSVIGFLDFAFLPKRHPMNVADFFLLLGGAILFVCIVRSKFLAQDKIL